MVGPDENTNGKPDGIENEPPVAQNRAGKKVVDKIWAYFLYVVQNVCFPGFKLIFDILLQIKYLLSFTTPILKSLLAIIIVAIIGYLIALKTFDPSMAFISAYIHSAKCSLPLSSYVFNCSSGTTTDEKIPPFSSVALKQTEAYQQIVDQQLRNTGSSALGVANHRIALRDLRTKIKYSTMSGAAEMASKLTEIIDESREVEDSLQRLEAKTRSSLDNLIDANAYALKMLKAYRESNCNANELHDTYNRMMDTIGSDLKRLITAATDSLGRLRNMDELMSVMYDIATRESKMQDITRKDLLTRIWYHLGNNVEMKENIALLTNYEQWHKSATAFVTSTYSILRSYQVDMEELRDSVVEYNLVQNFPIELHIESIRKSIERLRNTKAAQRSGVPQAEISEEINLLA